MALSSSLEDSDSEYAESDPPSSSLASGSTESEAGLSTAPTAKATFRPVTESQSPSSVRLREDEEPPEEYIQRPYTHSSSNVYTASSSLIAISGRPLSPRHSKPASADEILFQNPRDPEFKLPASVEMLLKDTKLLDDLPNSDLLKAVHRYAAEFYTAKGWDGITGRSMDESALLAIGIILEEYCRDMIGKNGDMVFLEREDD